MIQVGRWKGDKDYDDDDIEAHTQSMIYNDIAAAG